MTILVRMRNEHPMIGRASIVLTVLSLFGSNSLVTFGQESKSPLIAVEIAAPAAKPSATSSNEPSTTIESSPANTTTPAIAPATGITFTPPAPVPAAPAVDIIYHKGNAALVNDYTSLPEAQRLQMLEKRLTELTNELRALRGARRSDPVPPGKAVEPPAVSRQSVQTEYKPASKQPKAAAQRLDQLVPTISADRQVRSVTITRSTYKLPAGRAEALAKLLSEQLNDEIEIEAKGDSLQVTATAEDQQALGRVIGLFLRKGRAPEKQPETVPSLR